MNPALGTQSKMDLRLKIHDVTESESACVRQARHDNSLLHPTNSRWKLEVGSSNPEAVNMSESGITHCYLHGDVLTRSLRYLEWRDIITLRQVSSCWKLAARETHVEQEVYVQTRQALQILQTSLPKLQSLSLDQRSDDDVLEQDDEMSIPVIHRFSHLLHFQCVHRNPSPLRMVNLSALFASWPFLQSLNLHGNEELEWNLSDLICLKHLKDARFINNHYLRGNINDDLLYRTTKPSREEFRPTCFIISRVLI
jgi:hypothetical protein